MARVIPSGAEHDQTWRIAMHAAQQNEALARLFYQLMLRRDEMEQRRQERIEDRGQRAYERSQDRAWSEERQERSHQQQRELQRERLDEINKRNTPPDANQFNPLGPGAAGTPPPAAPSGAARIDTPIPGSQPTGPNTRSFTPQAQSQAPPTNKNAALSPEAMNAFAQAVQQPPPQIPTPRGSRTSVSNPTQVPAGTTRQPNEASYVPIREDILQAWAAAEDQFGLPRGTLLTTLGYENSGGRNLGKNPKSSANGPFQWTDELRRSYRVSPEVANDPIRMGILTAQNMRRNADQLDNLLKTKFGENAPAPLGNELADTWKYVVLHNFGAGDGPRLLYAAIVNPTTPAYKVMSRSPNDNYTALENNGIPGGVSVGDLMRNRTARIQPWQSAAIRVTSATPEQRQAEWKQQWPQQYGQQPQQQQQPTQAPQQSGDPVKYLMERARGARSEGMDPVFADRLAAAITEAEQATGSRTDIRSLARTREQQAQLYRAFLGGSGGLAAPPGSSKHEGGKAADIVRGPVLAWMHKNRDYIEQKYGLSFLRGRAFAVDPVHIQMVRPVDPNVRMFNVAAAPTPQPQQQQPPVQAQTLTDQPTPVERGAVTREGRPIVGGATGQEFADTYQPSLVELDQFGGTRQAPAMRSRELPTAVAEADPQLERRGAQHSMLAARKTPEVPQESINQYIKEPATPPAEVVPMPPQRPPHLDVEDPYSTPDMYQGLPSVNVAGSPFTAQRTPQEPQVDPNAWTYSDEVKPPTQFFENDYSTPPGSWAAQRAQRQREVLTANAGRQYPFEEPQSPSAASVAANAISDRIASNTNIVPRRPPASATPDIPQDAASAVAGTPEDVQVIDVPQRPASSDELLNAARAWYETSVFGHAAKPVIDKAVELHNTPVPNTHGNQSAAQIVLDKVLPNSLIGRVARGERGPTVDLNAPITSKDNTLLRAAMDWYTRYMASKGQPVEQPQAGNIPPPKKIHTQRYLPSGEPYDVEQSPLEVQPKQTKARGGTANLPTLGKDDKGNVKLLPQHSTASKTTPQAPTIAVPTGVGVTPSGVIMVPGPDGKPRFMMPQQVTPEVTGEDVEVMVD